MIYNAFQDLKLSALGMGCMRLPTLQSYEEINIPAVAEMVEYAMSQGINYYDTAWGYHGGNSERAMGEVLSKYPRESFYLASKFPGYSEENIRRAPEIFEEQLRKCKTDYFDFYLFHSVSDSNAGGYLDRSLGLYDYLMEQKRLGRIRHLGFSVHASQDTFLRFLDTYGDAIEFCQIQLNWLDWEFQDAKSKVEVLNARNIPIWVMEPVRGGSLCRLAPKYESALRALAPERSMPAWGFRYLQSLPGVTVTLSGMSNFEQLKDNIETYRECQTLTEAEMKALYDIAYEMTHKKSLPCTSCRYCTEKCPMELDIPRMIELYNEHAYNDGGFIAPKEMEALADDKKPSACIGCRACEHVCPQNIKISEMMADFASKLK
jgi:predicted aldo/keto reductase-like oxidoreductase